MQKRYAFFYLIGTLCNGLSGVLAYGLQQMVNSFVSLEHYEPWLTPDLTGWHRRLQRLEMDFHHRRHSDSLHRSVRLRLRGQLPRTNRKEARMGVFEAKRSTIPTPPHQPRSQRRRGWRVQDQGLGCFWS